MNYKIKIPRIFRNSIRTRILGAKAIQRMAKRELNEYINFETALLCAYLEKISVAEKVDISEDNNEYET